MNASAKDVIGSHKRSWGLRRTDYSKDYWDRKNPGRLWKVLLARAPADGRGVRCWQRWDWWKHPRTPIEWAIDIVKCLCWPIVVVTRTHASITVYGANLRKKHGIPFLRQWGHLLVLQAKHGIEPVSYYKFGLFEEEKRRLAAHFIENGINLLRILARRCPETGDRKAIHDKRCFELWCRAKGLPFVPTVMEFGVAGYTEQSVRSLPRRNLLSKPSNAEGGRGIHFWGYRPQGADAMWVDKEGRSVNAQQLFQKLTELAQARQRPILLQECLTNHREVRTIGNGGLCTIRVITVQFRGRGAEIVLAVIRIPVADSVVDSFDQEGLAATVDLGTGQCGPATRKRGLYPLAFWDTNPDTEAQIRGRTLPFWPETLRLAREAHDSLECGMPIIGWDIAILEGGPVLLESNPLPGSDLAQMPTGVPLGTTVYAECLMARLREEFEV